MLFYKDNGCSFDIRNVEMTTPDLKDPSVVHFYMRNGLRMLLSLFDYKLYINFRLSLNFDEQIHIKNKIGGTGD